MSRERVTPGAHRLPPRPAEVIDREVPLTFRWQGRPVPGYAGDTVVSALLASGVRTLSRSLKHRRPRGPLTASRHDPNTLLQVGDDPNVRAGARRVRPGDDVRGQNVWPSAGVDARAANRLLGHVLPSGFYYKTFMWPRQLRPAYARVLRSFSPGGRLPQDAVPARYEDRTRHVDVVVAGGGPAGIRAATAAAAAGASVLLVEEEHELGGHLRYDLTDRAVLDGEVEALSATDVEVWTDATVFGRYDGNWLGVVERLDDDGGERLSRVRASCLVVAVGLLERPYVFSGNDLPGVLLSTAAQRLIELHAVRPGSRAVVVSANETGDRTAALLAEVGVDVVRTLDARRGQLVRAARGRSRVQGVELHDGSRVDCDLLVTATGWTAPTSLLNMAGARPRYDAASARFVPGPLPDDVLATGAIAASVPLETALEHATWAGTEAARRARGDVPRDDGPALEARPHPAIFRGATHGFVDYSEDVSSKDLERAVAEGYDSVELLKRFTTVTMGPAQGKLETVNAVATLAAAVGDTIEDTGTTVWRPPYTPVSLGALAAGHVDPIRRSPLQPWHDRNGARRLVAGAWVRPDHFGDPEGEARAVRTGVGIIDVSPLGKLELRGADVVALLDHLYVNRWASLAVGRVRYGVMCSDDGVVFDDGVTGRLDDDRYVLTTTTGGAARVAERIEHVLQVDRPDWDVAVTDVTDRYASINVAGPRARDLLRRLTTLDLDPEAFPYLHVRPADVAGVGGAFCWRIGFTGELSYELHVPAVRGLHVWRQLLETGADLDVRPFGVEAQRILRLEKGHAIVGQDTDGLTLATSLGLGRMLHLDKDDAIGLPELRWSAAAGPRTQLVGLEVSGPTVPPEGCQLLVHGRIVGRITSSRWSPTLERPVCLALVDAAVATAGTHLVVRHPTDARQAATVADHVAAFDPDGERVRA